MLERQGYRVIEAESGPDALFMWEKHRDRVDLLLTDMVMPGGLSGFELAEKLRAEKPELKVIYNSGYTDDMLGENSPLRDKQPKLPGGAGPHKMNAVRFSISAPALMTQLRKVRSEPAGAVA